MNYNELDHTFAICAYKETKYLEACILSLLKQKVKTKIILCTSTPNAYIKEMCATYDIPLFINEGKSGLASDWNYAASCVKTPLYTLCHQDDYYFEDYAKEILEKANMCKDLIFIYTNYMEDKQGELVKDNTNLKIKKIMNAPMTLQGNWKRKWVRRRILSLGNPVGCPSVTFCKEKVGEQLFDTQFKNAADWDAWERLSKCSGEIVYCKEYLMAHRVHEESTTTLNIENNIRGKEDLEMFQRFWPKIIAKPLARIFGLSEKNNG